MKEKSLTKTCSVCGAEIAKNAKTCPQCGANNKKPIYKRAWFIIIIVIIVLIAMASALGGNTDDEQKKQDPKTSTTDNKDSATESELFNDFKLMNDGKFDTENDGYSITISGKVKNMTGKDLSYAQIEFTIYDSDGAQVGTALDNINNLEKDGVWKFKAICFDSVDGKYKYKLADITYW